MNQEPIEKDISNENTPKPKKSLCIWSVVSFILSLAAVGAFSLIPTIKNKLLFPVAIVLGIFSIIMPAIAKRIRISKDQSGKGFELAAIVLGGIAFYSVIYLLTDFSMYAGYFGWIVGGFAYKYAGKEKTK